MKKSMTAALLSAFIFPGIGHIYLKRYIPGVILAGVPLTGSYYVISKVINSALKIVKKIQSGAVQQDVEEAITELVSK